MTHEFRIVLAEVNMILKKTSIDIVKKIPYRFRKYIVINMDKTHIIDIDTSLPLENQNIKEKTKDILALIYRDYLISKEEREKLIKLELKRRKKIRLIKEQKTKNNDFFIKKERLQINEKLPIEIKSEKKIIAFIKKYINKITKIFMER